MSERPARKPRKPHSARVVRTERLTPHMQRVVLGGEGLAEFAAGTCTDHYVKMLFAPEGVSYPEPFDVERIREELPREQWPVTRTYTVRHWDAEHRELTLDFVLHGDEGLAGPWAMRVQPGETAHFMGPGGAYAPSPDADWHLFAGDESALPAIAAALEALPAGAVAHAFVEVSGPEEEQKIDSDIEVTWLHRGDRPVGDLLVPAVRELEWPEGRVHAFVHGEAHFVKELRQLLRVERELTRDDLSISGYWRLGHDEDGWQASKREWNARIEAEQETPAA
ncbi:siderophore-interacting protein [Streptomyces acidiscabies]|uniref:Siderophore-interacting protein n=1 Tax=Streptomyces acidiscabies TaxID=42234 RepID=A0AAP6EEI6_9ACTN|nr:siderophore-interacting protein [Streptomyces acidiscabies]MBP5940689.1 siderophore-interacting protein [Streptomyces sp. LBUM 1476]MBZ3911957.1 siderophore-interacting protein [Streptomyces acidiscabies]MDX2959764.1 siderophore-interacting protein [Streptomyces acidiscabies]MDX3022276.1 siderophore-interacting protein [Streptomyces acidiscabies]MDX3792558.1 siderophore-interacting protein [Streptomyces acidiscabies]